MITSSMDLSETDYIPKLSKIKILIFIFYRVLVMII